MQFIKNMIYYRKLIDICINRYESQKVVDNYFVGTILILGVNPKIFCFKEENVWLLIQINKEEIVV